jgi:hypothetical protein
MPRRLTKKLRDSLSKKKKDMSIGERARSSVDLLLLLPLIFHALFFLSLRLSAILPFFSPILPPVMP